MRGIRLTRYIDGILQSISEAYEGIDLKDCMVIDYFTREAGLAMAN